MLQITLFAARIDERPFARPFSVPFCLLLFAVILFLSMADHLFFLQM